MRHVCSQDLNNVTFVSGEDHVDEDEESSSAGYHTDESCSPTPDPGPDDETLRGLTCADVAVERLRERYAALYSLDALDNIDALRDAAELKAKILYSVVVVSPKGFE